MPQTLNAEHNKYAIRTHDGRNLALPFIIQPGIVATHVPVPVIAVPQVLQPHAFQVKDSGIHTYRIGDAVDLRGRLFNYREEAPQRWIITFRPNHDAYTRVMIQTDNEGAAWVAPPADQQDPQILVHQVLVGESDPPTYPPNALFGFEPVFE